MPDLLIPRESKEFVQVNVTVDGVAVVSGVDVAITAMSVRPTAYVAPITVAGKIGVLVGPGTGFILTTGLYQVWARVTSSPEVPVIQLSNRISIT